MVHGKCQASVSRGRANGRGPNKLPKMSVFRKNITHDGETPVGSVGRQAV